MSLFEISMREDMRVVTPDILDIFLPGKINKIEQLHTYSLLLLSKYFKTTTTTKFSTPFTTTSPPWTTPSSPILFSSSKFNPNQSGAVSHQISVPNLTKGEDPFLSITAWLWSLTSSRLLTWANLYWALCLVGVLVYPPPWSSTGPGYLLNQVSLGVPRLSKSSLWLGLARSGHKMLKWLSLASQGQARLSSAGVASGVGSSVAWPPCQVTQRHTRWSVWPSALSDCFAHFIGP